MPAPQITICASSAHVVELSAKVFPAWFDQHRAVREYDGRHAVEAVVKLCDELGRLVVAFDADLKIRDMVGFEVCLGAQAVGADPGGIHHNL